jgi:hypothetical protein
MIDAFLRNLMTVPRTSVMERTGRAGAGTVAAGGFVLGLGAAAAIATGHDVAGAVLLALSRVAAWMRPDERAVETILDFVVFAVLAIAFALADPSRSLAALFLMTGLLAAGMTQASLKSSGTLLTRLLGSGEVAGAFLIAALLPDWFSLIAYVLGVACFVIAGVRIADAVVAAGQQ